MLGESGGLAANRFNFEVGGMVLIGDEWLVILKINKTGDAISSLTTTARRHFYGSKYKADIESVKDYQAPQPDETAAVKAATKLPPMCNYPGDGFKHMTSDEWKRKKMSDVPQSRTHAATDTHGAHRTRSTWGGNWTTVSVYLTDAKRIDPPTKQAPLPPTEPSAAETLATMAQDLKAQNPIPQPHTPRQLDERIPSQDELHAMKKTAAAGVVTVAVPQLFPTPHDTAAHVVRITQIEAHHRVLDPSAGTGNLLRAVGDGPDKVAVEINAACVQRLTSIGLSGLRIHHADFLSCTVSELGLFDRIVMNPPFENGADIKHIIHALRFLKPGGILTAICANGPRQNAQLLPIVERHGGTWEELPADTFTAQGTNVRTVLMNFSTQAETRDPETKLRELWDAQGVPQAKQDEVIADIVAKAQPGAKIGPFTLR